MHLSTGVRLPPDERCYVMGSTCPMGVDTDVMGTWVGGELAGRGKAPQESARVRTC